MLSLYVFLSYIFQMVEMANFIHPGERALIKKILGVASEYRQLMDFIELYKHDTRIFTPLHKQSMYLLTHFELLKISC